MSFMCRLIKKLSSGGGATVVPPNSRSRSRSRMSPDERRHSPYRTSSVTKEPSLDESDRELVQYETNQILTNESTEQDLNKNSETQAILNDALPQSSSRTSDRTSQEKFCCNECFQEILKFRYKCLECSDFDLCHNCEAVGVHETHYMLRIPVSKSKSEAQIMVDCMNRALQSRELSLESTSSYRSDTNKEPASIQVSLQKILQTGGGELEEEDNELTSSNDTSESSDDEERYEECFYKTQGVEVDIDRETKQATKNKLSVLEILEEANEEDFSTKESVKEEVRQKDNTSTKTQKKLDIASFIDPTKIGFHNICENVPKGLNVLWQRMSPVLQEISHMAHKISDVPENRKIAIEISEVSDNSTASQDSSESIIHLLQKSSEKTEIREVVKGKSEKAETKELLQGTQKLVLVDNMPMEKPHENCEKIATEQQTVLDKDNRVKFDKVNALEFNKDSALFDKDSALKFEIDKALNKFDQDNVLEFNIDNADLKNPVGSNQLQETEKELPNLTNIRPSKEVTGKSSSLATPKISVSRAVEKSGKNITFINTPAKKSTGSIRHSAKDTKTRNVTIRCPIEKNANKNTSVSVTEKEMCNVTTPDATMKATSENISANASEKKFNKSASQSGTVKNTNKNIPLTVKEEKTCNNTVTVNTAVETLSVDVTFSAQEKSMEEISLNATDKKSSEKIFFTICEESENTALSLIERTSVESTFLYDTAEELTNNYISLSDTVKKVGKPIPLSTLEEKSSKNTPSISNKKILSKNIPRSATLDQSSQNVLLNTNEEKSNNIMPFDSVDRKLKVGKPIPLSTLEEKSSKNTPSISNDSISNENIPRSATLDQSSQNLSTNEEKSNNIMPLNSVDRILSQSSPLLIIKRKSIKIISQSASDKKSSKNINSNVTEENIIENTPLSGTENNLGKNILLSATEEKLSNKNIPLNSTVKTMSKNLHLRTTEKKMPSSATSQKTTKNIPSSATEKKLNKNIPLSATVKKLNKNISLSAPEKNSNNNIPLNATGKKSNKNIPLSATEKRLNKNIPLSATEKKSINNISLSPAEKKSSTNSACTSTSEEKSSKNYSTKKPFSPTYRRRRIIPPAGPKVANMKKTLNTVDTATPSLPRPAPAADPRRRLNITPITRNNITVLPKRWQDKKVLPPNKSREKSKLKDNSSDLSQDSQQKTQGPSAEEPGKKENLT